MLNLTSDNTIAFFSANAQIFGALLGLLGLAFVRALDSIERNATNLISSLMQELAEGLEDIEKRRGNVEIVLNVDLPELGNVIEKFKNDLSVSRYQILKARYLDLTNETTSKKSLNGKFRLNCWLSAGLIILSIFGLLLPFGEFTEIYLLGVLLGSIIGLVLTVRFFISITNTKSVFVSGMNK